MGFEISQYVRLGLWGTVDLFWPFIPYNVSMGSDFYYNFAVRPSIEAQVLAKAGAYIGLDSELLGITILSAEIGGGIYADVYGYIEAMDVIGLDENVGFYGSFEGWYYEVSAEVGGYLEANLGIALWDWNLFEKRWPFLEIEYQGEL